MFYVIKYVRYLKLLTLPLLVALACVFIGWYRPNVAAPHSFTAKVIYVYDGDTLAVRDGNYETQVIRLASVDAPERDQPYGLEATLTLKNLVLNKSVVVSVLEEDKYGRKVARVYYDNNKEVSTTLLRCGAAWHYGYFDRDKPYFETNRALETIAKKEKLGLWSEENPVAPWAWRANKSLARL